MKRCLPLGLALMLALTACNASSQKSSPTNAPGVVASATGVPTSAPKASGTPSPAPAQDTAAPASHGKPPQSSAAEIRPPERRPELTRLSNLLKFQVEGLNNVNLGQISDYIINTCETYIIYFVVDASSGVKLAAGSKLVIPFEAVTINSGALDAKAKAIVVQLSPDQLKAAPAVSSTLQLLPTAWEDGVRNYWQQQVRVGKLNSECRAGGGAPIQKIAYATQLIGADLKDGNHALLGTVQEGILEPESGKLGFYVVALQGNQGLVLVPLAKTNIPEEALKPGAKIELVLLADNNKLAGAPHITNLDQATDAGAQSAARGYWGQ